MFQNTVDILVGWHIDTQQDESLIEFIGGKSTSCTSYVLCLFCVDALVSMHQFWVDDISFSVDLLKQFLEDMDAYTNVSIGYHYHGNQKGGFFRIPL